MDVFDKLMREIGVRKEVWIMKAMAQNRLTSFNLNAFKLQHHVESPLLEQTSLMYREREDMEWRKIGEWKVWIEDNLIKMEGEVFHVFNRDNPEAAAEESLST